jgi:phosphatidylglycerophosphatase A
VRREVRVALLKDPVHLCAFGFGAGLVPWAPGTAGSAVGLAAAWAVSALPFTVRAALVAALAVAGVWLCGASARRLGESDPPAIVWDEIVAMMLTALALPSGAAWWLVAFVLFRFFDIAKPWPIRDLDHRLRGGMGIMLDDIVAAAYAAGCLRLAHVAISAF